jgi:hypothetical protein
LQSLVRVGGGGRFSFVHAGFRRSGGASDAAGFGAIRRVWAAERNCCLNDPWLLAKLDAVAAQPDLRTLDQPWERFA